ncbi:unnamed protein product [Pylaiella littoralis]
MRRLLLRCRQQRGRSRRGRLRGMSVISSKVVLLFTVAVAGGLYLLLALVTWRIHWSDSADEFIETFQTMYEQGERKVSAVKPGESNGDVTESEGQRTRRYDPKARAYVDPSLQAKHGHEANKGRHKRRLFMEVHEMTKAKGRPQLTLHELMAMPSSFDSSKGVSDTTVILNQWRRTTLEEQLEAILRQTVRPAGGVWVCAFNSPRESEYRESVEKYRPMFEGEGGGLFFVASSFNFKYYGRFQMALQARTKYVWIVDDDVMPGNHFLHQLSHVAGISEAEGADGSIAPMALGSVGWVMPGVKATEAFYSYRYPTDKGGLYLPDKRYGIPVPHLQEVDLLCSHWFVETDWVKLLFREKWETSETGEDYMLAYSLRKHAGVRSYVLPMDLGDSETWGNVDVDWSMQHQGGGATTLGSIVPVRDEIWHRLLKRGGEYFMSLRYAARPRPILLVVDSPFDALALRALFLDLQASYPPTTGGSAADTAAEKSPTKLSEEQHQHQRPPRVVLTGRGGESASCSLAAKALGNTKGERTKKITMCNPSSFASAWNLLATRHFPRRQGTGEGGGGGGRGHELMVDLAAGLAGAVKILKPLAIVSIAGTGPSAGAHGGVGGIGAAIDEALAVVGEQGRVPLIRLPREPQASEAALWLTRLTPKAFRAWHRPRVDVVVVYEPSGRSGDGGHGGHTEAQLKTLLESLSSAHYVGDSVRLTVAVGSGPVPDIVGDDLFSWPHGRKVVRGGSLSPSATARNGSSGGDSSSLAALAFRSWVPRDDDNFVVVLEADRVVSRFFYSWLKVAMLEMSYGGAAPKLSTASAAQPGREEAKTGVCVPAAEASGGGNGGGSSTWLLPGGHWRAAQAGCLGNPAARGEGRRRGGERSTNTVVCDGAGYPEPPTRSLCPALEEPAEALVGRTGADGGRLGSAGHGLMEDGQALANFVGRVLW